MSKTLEFYFDFASPTTYLAHKRLQQLREQYDLIIEYKPMLLGGVFKATGNTTPVAIPAKGKYMLESDLPRFCERYNVELNLNPHFPVNTLTLMRIAIGALEMDCLETYLDAAFDAMWLARENMGDAEVISRCLTNKGLDAQALMDLTQQPEVKAALIAATEEAVARGCFGAPTLFMDGEMYFGQDRLDFIEEVLRQA